MNRRVLFIAFVSLLLHGCKKEDVKSGKQCRIISVTRNDDKQNFYFTYNAGGKVASMVSLPSNNVTTYVYEGNIVKGTRTHNGQFDDLNIMTYNENGFTTNVRNEYDQTGINWFNQAVEYDGTYLQKITLTSSTGNNPPIIGEYVWEGGNLVQETADGQVFHHDYYPETPYQAGDWVFLQQLIGQYKIYAGKNLRRSTEKDGEYIFYKYAFDDEGKIISVQLTSASENVIYNYEYECY